MNEPQVQELVNYIGQLWPKNDLDDADFAAWRRTLARIHHPDIARQALGRLKDTTDFLNPKRATFLDLLAKQTNRPRPPEDPAAEAHPGFIMCVKHENPGHVGWFVPLCYSGDKSDPPPQVIREHLDEMARKYEAMYGGEWLVYHDDHRPILAGDMLRLRNDLRKPVSIADRTAQRAEAASNARPPGPLAGSLRSAAREFFNGKGPATPLPAPEPEPDYYDDGPPPSDEEAASYPQPEYEEEVPWL